MSRAVYGPLRALWHVSYGHYSGASFLTRDNAEDYVSHLETVCGYPAETIDLSWTEHCPVPGCNGDGTRRGMSKTVACHGCRGVHNYKAAP